MGVENWIDTLCSIWEISDGKGGTVYSYRVYEKSEFPEAITETPVALTYTEGVEMQIMASGGQSIWRGFTEFHITQNVDKSHFPEIMLYFKRIRVAIAANLTLGGLVSHLKVRPEITPNVQGPLVMKYGSEDPHHGIIVFWEVKESETDVIPDGG